MSPETTHPEPNAQPAASGPTAGQLDVIMQGTVFLDIVLTGLPSLPAAGTEVFAEGMGSCPGGMANLAVATARLGLKTGLAAAFGDDSYGDFLWTTLSEQEGIDLSASKRFDHWHSPVTVSLAINRDRAMVTHEHPPPAPLDDLLNDVPPARAGVLHLGTENGSWAEKAAAAGTLLFGDVGWDPTELWAESVLDDIGRLYAFLPNSTEAMAYTRTEDPRAALMALADLVPTVIVTCGGQGSIGLDGVNGEEEWVPALPVNSVDATGAGDVFAAAFIVGSLRDWPLRQRMAFGNLCAGLAVQQVGGSLAAPGWGDIADWFVTVKQRSAAGSRPALALRHSYEFLEDVVPSNALDIAHGPGAVRRASATIARFSDA